jgi:site-specific DNA-methyltransferase (adenine-specific)/adenine-specific DNA-methyltransferase
MDEIFGAHNFVATVIWHKMFSTKNTARHFSESHDYIVVYAKNAATWRPNLLPRGAEQDARYKNPDNDPRGPWTSSDLSARNYYSLGEYSIECPSGRVIEKPPAGRYWTISKENFELLKRENRIWWGKNGSNMPRLKRFLSEVQDGLVPDTIWAHSSVGHTQEAKKELTQLLEFRETADVFVTPKPSRLIERILSIASCPGDLVLDSFAGSGTTGHAVLKLNKAKPAEAPRRFILVEIESTVATNITAERVRRAISGGEKVTQGLGGGFRFCKLGAPLFDETGNICTTVRFADLARHVYFMATGEPLPRERVSKSPLIGAHAGLGVYLLYNGILGDRSTQGGNVLTRAILNQLPSHDGPKVIYCAGCLLGKDRLQTEQITIRQIPYDLNIS